MSKYTKEINQEDIKAIVSAHKAARYNSGWILEAKLGKISIDLSELKVIDGWQLYARRISGNGKMMVNLDENHTSAIILSKVAQSVELTGCSSKLEISRPADSTGEICIFGLTINYNLCEEDTALSYNWKSLISKCGKYACLRMVGNRLFASEGAYIEQASIIKSITTIPPNMYFRDGAKLKFLSTCEVTDIVVDNTYTAQYDVQSYIQHRDAASPEMDLSVNYPQPPPPPPQSSPNLTDKTCVPNLASNIMYDSDIFRGLQRTKISSAINNKNTKSINSNGKDYLLLRRSGSFSIPMSSCLPNKEYVVSLTTKRLNGNGKISVGISSGDAQPNYYSVIADNNFFEKYATFTTGSLQPGETFKLTISMLDDGVGEVLISRILVIESIPRLTRKEVLKDLEFSREPPLVLSYNYSDKSNVKNDTKRAALIFAEKYDIADAILVNHTIEPLTVSAKKWVAKSYISIPGLKIKDNKRVMRDVIRTDESPNLVMSALGFLKVSERIFIEEWNAKLQPNEIDIAILSQCNTICTPSVVNSQILKQILPSKNIVCIPRFWPATNVSARTGELYFLYFEKNQRLTELLIDYWQLNYPKLYVVGSTKGLPPNMQHLSEYLPYKKIMEYVLGSLAIIDLSDNNNYASGINILTIENDINLITNNLYYLSQNYGNIKFLNSKTTDVGVELDKIQIRLAVEEMISKEQKSNSFKDIYMQAFKQNVCTLLGM